mmetsp:Transcript_17937/g.27730  ORF Transcript_17937/g.27730 Transcript_17937/m.27730 type:complete len:179 (+) Transcript_17937:568-1104(+)
MREGENVGNGVTGAVGSSDGTGLGAMVGAPEMVGETEGDMVGCSDGAFDASSEGDSDGTPEGAMLMLGDEVGTDVGAGVGFGVLGTQPHRSPLVKAWNILQFALGTNPCIDLRSSCPHVNVPTVGMLTTFSGSPTAIRNPHGLQYGWFGLSGEGAEVCADEKPNSETNNKRSIVSAVE